MEMTNYMEHFEMNVNDTFVKKAEALEPELMEKIQKPAKLVKIVREERWRAAESMALDRLNGMELGKGDSVCFDFGDHMVGYLSFSLKTAGSPPDAPAHIRVKFGETCCEIGEETGDYQGALSSGWLQEEFLHVDVLPARIAMPRRYAFRYAEIKVMDTSAKYRIIIEDVEARTVTSADEAAVRPLASGREELKQLDRIAVKTLMDCMQKVFEDGPKRDRRLWIGDLRLQALANYETFKNYDLVKRCLYLFAGLTQNEGRVGACLFLEPGLQVDDTALFDYSLFFISCLLDYYEASNDMEALEELWDTAYRQLELAARELDSDGVIKIKYTWWCFIDWQDKLDKQAPAQAVFIYTLKQAARIAEYLDDRNRKAEIQAYLNQTVSGAVNRLWDNDKGFFVSGADRQVSWASQVWFVLAGILPEEENKKLLIHLIDESPKIGMVTPYMYHHFIEALVLSGMKEEAICYMNEYWGGMVREGADCFYELYDPKDPEASPYGSRVINSYCHAWSCTPSYFIRKYFI